MSHATRHNASCRVESQPATPTKAPGSAEHVRSFLAATAEPVRELLSASIELREFRRAETYLTLSDRRLLVEQAITLLEDNYVHLPLKSALHAVNPVRRLKRLKARLRQQTKETMGPELAFHSELSEIFSSLRDLHTTYHLPRPFADRIAYLPFLIEECRCNEHDSSGDRGSGSQFVVSRLVEGFESPGFECGVEVTHWNGIPIARAVEMLAARFAGSNPAAQRARAIESLTLRQLATIPPPDEDWARITFIANDSGSRDLQWPWLVVENYKPEADLLDPVISLAGTQPIGLDVGADELNRARRMLFAPVTIERARKLQAPEGVPAAAVVDNHLSTRLEGVFHAGLAGTPSGTFGHVRIFTFRCDPDAFVDEFVRLIELLPKDGLIVDLRGNPGGAVMASELTLQTLSPLPIEPEPFQFINTEQNLALCRGLANPLKLEPWIKSMELGLETGEIYSGAYPITPKADANARGQKYHGPVVLITDARCYSAADVFAAGFQDHDIGPILGVDDNTGAGGAEVWTLAGIQSWLLDYPPEGFESPFADLPQSAGIGLAIRRSLRVGRMAGTPLEDLGVIPDPDHVHRLTHTDIVSRNEDLLNRAGELLANLVAEGRRRKLNATATLAGDDLS
ncbi:MAG TPA: S41 family peptidase, partial [Thermomicrobiales bacterium]|nr:S41 family peptidase [Thermomicrobiales bacterium]